MLNHYQPMYACSSGRCRAPVGGSCGYFHGVGLHLDWNRNNHPVTSKCAAFGGTSNIYRYWSNPGTALKIR